MAFTLPPAVNFRSPLVAVPAVWNRPPREGSKFVPIELAWGAGNDGGAYNCILLNLQNNATLEFSQIVSLTIDNSQCGADVTFVFPDTAQTYTVPAYTPVCDIPVFTQQTQMYVYCPNALTGDVTRGAIHNDVPPPVSLPTTTHQQTIYSQSLDIDLTPDQIIAAGIRGTIEAISLNTTVIGALSDYSVNFQLVDGAATVIAGVISGGPSGSSVDGNILNLSGINARFENGLTLTQSGTDPGLNKGVVSLNVFYKIP